MGWLSWLLHGRGHGVDELARRLGIEAERLLTFEPQYRRFTIAKRSGGGRRTILAPDDATTWLQRRILRRVLARLRTHPAAHGFERRKSIVSNARPHVGRSVVVRLDLVDFFSSTGERRIRRYFRKIGWNRPAARLLLKLCTWEGALPQGAPTSPRLSNLVNYRLDARLAGVAARFAGSYTRYADDLTFSLDEAGAGQVGALLRMVQGCVNVEGYRVHKRRKLHVRRRHHQQRVTGLVVNEKVNLPRTVRRWLRAVEHRANQDWRSQRADREQRFKPRPDPTLSPEQLQGWRALRNMIGGSRKHESTKEA